MSEPRFDIGDFVYWKQDLRAWRENAWPIIKKSATRDYVTMGELGLRRLPMALQVVEVLIQRCYGGEQIHYAVRQPSGEILKLTEHELTDEAPEPEAA